MRDCMVFCPSCKALMFPKESKFVCTRCGFEKTKDVNEKAILVEKREEKETTFLETPADVSKTK